MMTLEEGALKLAKKTAKEAGKKIIPLFGRVSNVKERQNPTDIYSDADLLAEKIIFSTLFSKFPHFNYLSEETEEHKMIDKESEYTWVVDPLDGSIPFVAGLEYWGISIGLIKESKPVVGVIYVPMKNWLFSAKKNQGAFLNGQRISVSKNKEYDKAIIGFDLGHRGFRREDLLRNIAPQVENVRYMPSFACTTFGQILVAKGSYDAYLHHRAFPWDFCAGAVIIQESGGKITDHRGNSLDWTKKDNMFVLASNGLIHEEVLKAIRTEI